MIEQIEILKYEETPECKHMGVVHVRLFKQVVLRFKIVPKKDGSGFFVTGPAYKRETEAGEKWLQWFVIDSQVFAEEINNEIELFVVKFLASQNTNQAPTGFDQQQPVQQGNLQDNTQQVPYPQQQPVITPTETSDALPF